MIEYIYVLSAYNRFSSLQIEYEGADCVDMEYSNLNETDIETVLDSHNFYRIIIASGKENRGNPGPQPAAKTMMELVEKSTKHARRAHNI